MMDGQFYEFYCELERAARQLPSRAATLCELLAQRMQDVGYRGLRPDPNQMQSDLRLFERAVKQANEERTE
ncbi:MAG: hypothetical protein HY706_12090 [Candidatus Hydrogenedentes bacterium]|nr:hypothetical protein [Candidatus Hydrogenedentota bacterium]